MLARIQLAKPILVLLAAVTAALGLAGPAAAQEPPPTTTTTAAPSGVTAVAGTIRVGDDPIEDVVVTVTDATGAEVDEVETDEEGAWLVEVPAPGPYTIALDEDTLPEDVTIREGARSSVEIDVPPGLTRQVAFPLVGPEGGGARDGGRSLTDELAQSAVNGVKFGLIIAITSVGLSLIFGTTGLVNFAHGELVAFGAIVAWFLNTRGPELQLIAAAVIAVAIGVALGGGLELSLWRPLRRKGAGAFQRMVISIGLSLAARQVLLIWFGSRSLRYRDYTIQTAETFGPIAITPRDLWVMALSVLALVAVAAMLQRTRTGRAMRAVADNADLAESSGVDVQRIILVVWALGAGLAALGGIFQATITNVNHLMGFQLLLLMFAGVILGGLGTAYGAMVGGIAVGLATEVSTVWFSSELKYVWALAVLIVVLLVRPQGILGTRERVG
jgi:branched-chain amino acid transport system permease protein